MEIKPYRIKLLKAIRFAIEEMQIAAKVKADKQQFRIMYSAMLAIKRNFKFHYLICDPENKSLVSFAKSPDDRDNLKRRVKTTLRRYIRRELELDATKLLDKTLDLFGDLVNFSIEVDDNVDNKIQYLYGQDIIKFYKTTSSSSCMTGKSSKYTELYAANPDKVCIVVIKDRTRALLWTDDNGIKILDRTYPSGHYTTVWLKQWAKNKGYIRRSKNCMIDYTAKRIDTTDVAEHKITLNKTKKMPYLDTFRFMTKLDNDKILLSNYERNAQYVIANQLDILKILECDFCHCRSVDIENHDKHHCCNSCFVKYFTKCSYCNKLNQKINFINIKSVKLFLCNERCLENYKMVCLKSVSDLINKEIDNKR
jgi:hypothetical protein